MHGAPPGRGLGRRLSCGRRGARPAHRSRRRRAAVLARRLRGAARGRPQRPQVAQRDEVFEHSAPLLVQTREHARQLEQALALLRHRLAADDDALALDQLLPAGAAARRGSTIVSAIFDSGARNRDDVQYTPLEEIFWLSVTTCGSVPSMGGPSRRMLRRASARGLPRRSERRRLVFGGISPPLPAALPAPLGLLKARSHSRAGTSTRATDDPHVISEGKTVSRPPAHHPDPGRVEVESVLNI